MMEIDAVIWLAAVVVVFNLTLLALVAFWGWAFRAGIAEVSVGLGPTIARLQRVTIRLFPVGGHLRFLDGQLGEVAGIDAQTHDALPPWKRIGLVVAPLASILCICWASLGPAAWSAYGGGFEQLLRGALSPMSAAQSLLARLIELFASAPLIVAAGWAWTKLCALSTVTMLIGPGNSLAAHVLVAIKANQRRIVAAQYLGILALCFLVLPWLCAAGWFLWGMRG